MSLTSWKGPAPGFYGPRGIAIAPDGSIYVVDQGHTRIVRFRPDGRVLSIWAVKERARDSLTILLRSRSILVTTEYT